MRLSTRALATDWASPGGTNRYPGQGGLRGARIDAERAGDPVPGRALAERVSSEWSATASSITVRAISSICSFV
jgi:hypothetical protein